MNDYTPMHPIVGVLAFLVVFGLPCAIAFIPERKERRHCCGFPTPASKLRWIKPGAPMCSLCCEERRL